MNNSQALAEIQTATFGENSSRWFAQCGDSAPIEAPGFDCRLVAGTGRSQKLYVGNETEATAPVSLERFGCAVVFDGVLFNRKVLRDELGELASSEESEDAALILAGYERWGENLFSRLRGTFALVFGTALAKVLLCLRDPLGCYPLFYATGCDGFLVAMSIDVLLQQPGVSTCSEPGVNGRLPDGALSQARRYFF